MPEVQTPGTTTSAPTYRLHVTLHELLMKPPKQPRLLSPPRDGKQQTLPEPVFPQFPELMDAPDEVYFPEDGKRKHKAKHIYRAMRRAGHNSLIVRVDGTLAPCFPMYSAGYDWGTIENHKFETKQLKEMKKECQKSCFLTLNHILAFCYNDRRVITWLLRQAKYGFRRIEGNFGD